MTRTQQIEALTAHYTNLGCLDSVIAEHGPLESWDQRSLDNEADELETEEEGE